MRGGSVEQHVESIKSIDADAALMKFVEDFDKSLWNAYDIDSIYLTTERGDTLVAHIADVENVRAISVATNTLQDPLWAYKWWGKPLGYFLSAREREEWMGDLKEIQEQMILEDRYPVRFVNAIVVVKGCLLIWVKGKCEFVEIITAVIGKIIG